ncbi:M24 family metallopeptidase [bacterium]|nr:M24 family metallopeptidase [bacterium]
MKLEFVRKKLAENHADAYVILNHEGSGQPDTAYLSGFSGSESVIIVTATQQYILVDGRYFTRSKQEAPNFEMRAANRGRVYDDMAKYFPEMGIKSILIDPNATAYSSIKNFESKIPGLNIHTAPGMLFELRMIKSQEEINKLHASGDVACAAFNQLVTEIKPGMTERAIAARLEFLMKDMGADKYSFDTIVASGKMGAFPHYTPSSKEIATGELVTIDFGCYLDGYASDMTRTIAIGEISDKLRDIYETVKGSQQAGLDAANSSMTGIALDKVCRDYIEQRNYGEYFLHGTGHGLGLDVHELPYVNTNNNDLLPVNSVVSIEPGIYIEGIGGVRIEDCVVIKENGCINLNDKVTKELITV